MVRSTVPIASLMLTFLLALVHPVQAQISDPIVASTCQLVLNNCASSDFTSDTAAAASDCVCGPGLCPSPPRSEGYYKYSWLPAPTCPAGSKLFHSEITTAVGGVNVGGSTVYSCWECCAFPEGQGSPSGGCSAKTNIQDVTNQDGVRPSYSSTEDPPPARADAVDAPPAAATESAPSGVQGGVGSGSPPTGSALAMSGMGSGYRGLVVGCLALAYGAV